jgi:hypothetical protein
MTSLFKGITTPYGDHMGIFLLIPLLVKLAITVYVFAIIAAVMFCGSGLPVLEPVACLFLYGL